MAAALRAGFFYFLIAFALGVFRVMVVIPRLGDTNAVLIELPVMLALSWMACAWLVRRFAVPRRTAERLAMGALAFALLMLGELAVSVFGFGRTVAEHLATYQTPGAQLGLAAQLVFALLPLVQDAAWRRQ